VIVSEVFEVMTQVDHDLTTVNRLDQHLGLIKNLGRHNALHMYGKLRRQPLQWHWSLVKISSESTKIVLTSPRTDSARILLRLFFQE
jgi:hypothetical protein